LLINKKNKNRPCYQQERLSHRLYTRRNVQFIPRDSERGVFKAVICWKMDRFARNRYDAQRNGVRIHYAKEFIPEGPEGIILESVMEGYAEYYSENLSQNIKRGYLSLEFPLPAEKRTLY